MSDSGNSTQNDTVKQTIKNLEGLSKAPDNSSSHPAIKLESVPPKDYDIKLIEDFLDVVFHAGVGKDEHILTWAVAPYRSPIYPMADTDLLAKLKSSRHAKALYFGTATFTPDPEDGKLYNRKKLFTSLRVIMLDDIGTKVKIESLPEALETSYELETSEGNFQYGLVLDEPIEDLAAAEAFVHLIYESGYSDEGGKMANKLVRLPDGVNGKKGKAGFVTKVHKLSDKTFSPQQILDMCNVNVLWEEVLTDAEAVTKKRASKSIGSSPWATTQPVAMALNGIIDPVLEWLYDEGQVVCDNGGDFVEILCPWGHNHTSGGDTAGYAPIGRGDDITRRGFNCFHEGCSNSKTPEFLRHVASNSGIEVGVHDQAAALTAKYVFDKVQNVVWDIKSEVRELKLKMDGFVNTYPHKLPIYEVGGEVKRIGAVSMWKTSPSRVVVAGATYDPSTTARITEMQGEHYVNLFSIPNWGRGAIDNVHVAKFNEYLEYLVPDKSDREYFVMWLAAKCQNMAFRGAALVMVAQKQGVGRSTLGDMIATLMGNVNVANVSLSEMLGNSDFNEWQAKPFVIIEETLAGDRKDFYSNYEKLKGFIDPRATTITINHKYGHKITSTNYASYLFLTNHSTALAMPDTDRRFMVIQNAYTPAKPDYFSKLNKWLMELDTDGLPLWARHLYRWLQTVEVDIEFLTSPPPKTEAKNVMARAALSDIDFAVKKIIELWPDPYVSSSDVVAVLQDPVLAGALHMDDTLNVKYIRVEVNNQSVGFDDATVIFKHKGKAIRPRILHDRIVAGGSALRPDTAATRAKHEVKEIYKARDALLPALVDQIKEALELEGRI
tara:strand:+ start:71 stop:2572 length:2502 start_codon:yes stop_codon:yes gene_type:complete